MSDDLRQQHQTLESALTAVKNGSIMHLNKTFIDDFFNSTLIYFLTNQTEEKKSEVVYIGQTTSSLCRRLMDHIEDKQFDSICFFFVDESIINELEEILISIWLPKYNIRGTNWYVKQVAKYAGINNFHCQENCIPEVIDKKNLDIDDAIEIIKCGFGTFSIKKFNSYA